MKAIVFDVETTGFGTEENPSQIIEAAWVDAEAKAPHFVQRYCPTVPLTPGAMAVHLIIPDDLTCCPHPDEFALPEGLCYLIGHNIDFDWKMAGEPAEVKRICTLALSRWLIPQLDSHKLGALMFHFYPPEVARDRVKGAHSALEDVLMTRDILQHLIEIARESGYECRDWEQLWMLSEQARVPTIWTFGKHKDKRIDDPDRDVRSYAEWFIKQKDVDPYLMIALKKALGRA